jgi:mono/diheme cytochrome c family protein
MTALLRASTRAAEIPAAQLEFFESRIRPLLVEHCYKCHSADAEKLKGGLRLDTREGVRKGGDSKAAAAVPGDVEHSKLIEAVRWKNPDLQMPPKHKLTDKQIDDLVAWVKLGAPDPRDEVAAPGEHVPLKPAANAKEFWTFKKPTPQAIPEVKESSWARTPIDRFILARLEQKNLKHSAEADRRTLIRRATFDLTGLPPTKDEVDAFVNDASSNAYEKLVDGLLSSPHYGERWGRYWLDLARYSDTKGYVYGDREDANFVGSYVYRDWVVKALNDDVPYDQFLVQQIAADQLLPTGPMAGVGESPPNAINRPSLAALGFLTVGRRFLNIPHDIIDDRIDVLCRTTQALTVACARCHDHKFDPIPTQDYYSLYGVFAASRENLVPLVTNVPPTQRTPQYEQYEKGLAERVKKLNDTFEQYKGALLERLRRKGGDYLAAVPEVAKTREELFYLVLDPEDLNPVITRQWQAYLVARAAKGFDPVFAPWNELSKLARDPASFESQSTSTIHLLQVDGDHKLNPVVAKALAEKPPKNIGELAKLYGEVFAKSEAAWKELKKANAGAKALADADLEQIRQVLYGADTPCSLPPGSINDLTWFFEEKGKVELGKAQKEIDVWINTAAGAVPHELILEDKPGVVPNPHVLKRGNPINPGEEVPRQYLSIVAGEKRETFKSGSGRLEMAKAIANAENPLTARVIVNRIWMHHFGAGIIRTPSDFGVRSEAPSHRELLDHLATWFQGEAGWSLKKLHRQIMLSATYRQSSVDDAASRQVDPENRLLWHFPRTRLDMEAMRDAMLLSSGELDQTMGGRPGDIFGNRRTVYAKVDRQFLPGMARAFDFANPDLHIPQRSTTTIPQQALFFMNSPFVMARARSLAARPEVAYTYAPADKVKRMYRALYQRDPNATELDQGVAFVKEIAKLPAAPEPPPVPTMWQYGYGDFDPAAQTVKKFTPLPHFTGEAYQGGSAWPSAIGWVQLTATGGHAGDDHAHAAVRRWVAPMDCKVVINGTVEHKEAPGDGIRAFIIPSRGAALGSWTVHNSKAGHSIGPVVVKQGDTIDFVVDCGAKGDVNSDMFAWAPVITTQPFIGVPADVYDAKKQFAGVPTPAAPPMDPWQQFAQVLMQSNEFLFVD